MRVEVVLAVVVVVVIAAQIATAVRVLVQAVEWNSATLVLRSAYLPWMYLNHSALSSLRLSSVSSYAVFFFAFALAVFFTPHALRQTQQGGNGKGCQPKPTSDSGGTGIFLGNAALRSQVRCLVFSLCLDYAHRRLGRFIGCRSLARRRQPIPFVTSSSGFWRSVLMPNAIKRID